MISASELRIGNFIYDDENQIAKVERIESNDFYKYNGSDDEQIIYSINGTMRMSSEISPVPISEDILFKCGFVESTIRTDFKLKLRICAINLYCRFNTEWYFELEGIYLGSTPKYLHQLQNLYFALTGKELDVKI